MSTNLIADNMFSQVDDEEHILVIFEEIVDVRSNQDTIKESDSLFLSSNGSKSRRKTTEGWDILIKWKNGSTTRNKVKNVKALEIDAENRNDPWWKATTMEMKNVKKAFRKHEEDTANLVGYQESKCRIIFDMTLGENFL